MTRKQFRCPSSCVPGQSLQQCESGWKPTETQNHSMWQDKA